jgi:hypothetical protein
VLLRHWTLPATASGHAFGSRTPCAYIRTCTRVRVHTHYTVTHDPSPTLLHMEWSRGRGLVAPSS